MLKLFLCLVPEEVLAEGQEACKVEPIFHGGSKQAENDHDNWSGDVHVVLLSVIPVAGTVAQLSSHVYVYARVLSCL